LDIAGRDDPEDAKSEEVNELPEKILEESNQDPTQLSQDLSLILENLSADHDQPPTALELT
jgi:hypothetical protein